MPLDVVGCLSDYLEPPDITRLYFANGVKPDDLGVVCECVVFAQVSLRLGLSLSCIPTRANEETNMDERFSLPPLPLRHSVADVRLAARGRWLVVQARHKWVSVFAADLAAHLRDGAPFRWLPLLTDVIVEYSPGGVAAQAGDIDLDIFFLDGSHVSALSAVFDLSAFAAAAEYGPAPPPKALLDVAHDQQLDAANAIAIGLLARAAYGPIDPSALPQARITQRYLARAAATGFGSLHTVLPVLLDISTREPNGGHALSVSARAALSAMTQPACLRLVDRRVVQARRQLALAPRDNQLERNEIEEVHPWAGAGGPADIGLVEAAVVQSEAPAAEGAELHHSAFLYPGMMGRMSLVTTVDGSVVFAKLSPDPGPFEPSAVVLLRAAARHAWRPGACVEMLHHFDCSIWADGTTHSEHPDTQLASLVSGKYGLRFPCMVPCPLGERALGIFVFYPFDNSAVLITHSSRGRTRRHDLTEHVRPICRRTSHGPANLVGPAVWPTPFRGGALLVGGQTLLWVSPDGEARAVNDQIGPCLDPVLIESDDVDNYDATDLRTHVAAATCSWIKYAPGMGPAQPCGHIRPKSQFASSSMGA